MRKLSGLIVAALLGLNSSAWGQAAAASCSGNDLISDFSTKNVSRGFAAEQKQDGSLKLRADPVQPDNQVAYMTAGPKRNRVGKGALIYRFSPVGIGNYAEMSAKFRIPSGTKANSIILMDLECATCGVDTNPGLRLYLRDGRIRVDRSKIGVKEPFLPKVDHQIKNETWYNIRWRVDLGDREQGRSEVFLDGQSILQNRGTTLLTQRIVSQLANIQVEELIDRFQVGLTANSNRSRAELLVDDVHFCVGKS